MTICDKLKLPGHLDAVCRKRDDYRAIFAKWAIARGTITRQQAEAALGHPPRPPVQCLYFGAATGNEVETLAPD